jgi:hypothetical protein
MTSLFETTQGNSGKGINIFGDYSIGYCGKKRSYEHVSSPGYRKKKELLDSPEQIQLDFLQNKGW